MLKQLRRKFILINMLLVSLVLLVVLTVQMVTAWRQVTAQSEEALRRAVLWGESGPDPLCFNIWLITETSIPTAAILKINSTSISYPLYYYYR